MERFILITVLSLLVFKLQFLGHGRCHNLSKSMEIPGSVSTRDAKIICDIGMTLFRELAIPPDDLRGMGLVMSKLTNAQSMDAGKVTTLSNGLAKWLEKGEESTQQTTTGAFENPYGSINDVVANLPKHFQLDILNDEDHLADASVLQNLTAIRDRCFAGIGERRHSASLSQTEPMLGDHNSVEQRNISDDCDVPRQNENHEIFTQIVLPPLSQIKMSQVEALPSEMQGQIMSAIREKEATEAAPRHNQEPVLCIDVDSPEAYESVEDYNAGESSEKFVPDKKATEGHQQCAYSKYKGGHRFRQTDVKRMMRLAAVKSGGETTSISLTQLDHLPLEIKLQVVNEDTDSLGALSQNRPRRESTSASYNRLTDQPIEHSEEKGLERSIGDTEEISSPTGQEAVSIDEKFSSSREEPPMFDPVDVYQDDIVPLKIFLDENPPIGTVALNSVVEFLVACLKEGRLKDIVTLIRSIRNRGDDWSCKTVLHEIVQRLDEAHHHEYRTRLDVDWIVGK